MSEPAMDAETRSSLPEQLESTSDAASSLRAAALLTLKSKRRRNLTNSPPPSLPSRPLPLDNNLQLDYGQEEPSVAPRPALLAVRTHKPPASSTIEDVQMREEGEISDEESGPPPTPSRAASHTSTPPPPTPDISRLTIRSTPPATYAMPKLLPQPTSSDRIPGPSSSAGSFGRNGFSIPLRVAPVTPPDNANHHVDTEHVRPGVALNQSQYDAAKDLVLDLLGWGVHPEYLVDCGLTREIVFYVFHELCLRLPQNLDTTGLTPYTPRGFAGAQVLPPSTPKGIAPSDVARTSSLATIPNISPAQNTRSNSMEGPHTPSAHSLHDMEQQRRQELLARKAAIASRKTKQSTSSDMSIPTSAAQTPYPYENLGGRAIALTESVDDFLKSIDPTSPTNSHRNQVKADPSPSPDQMDVDGPKMRQSDELPMPPPTSATSTLTSSTDDQVDSLPVSVLPVKALSRAPSTEYSSPSKPVDPPVQRRGVKRPVAVDFDDFDNSWRASSSPNSNGSQSNGSKRKNMTGFASVSQRRCVIDLSDSEGEEAAARETIHAWRRAAPPPALPTRQASLSSSSNSAGRVTPPTTSGASANGGPSGTMSPAALMAKEKEIQKMKEMIALMEQSRSIKLAKSASSADISAPGSAFPAVTNVKQDAKRLCTSADILGIDESRESAPADGPAPSSNDVQDTANDDVKVSPSTHDEGTKQASPLVSVSTAREVLVGDNSVDVDLASSSSSAQVHPTMQAVHQRPDENQDQLRQGELPEEQSASYESPFRLYPLLRSTASVLSESPPLLLPSSSNSPSPRFDTVSSLSSLSSLPSSSTVTASHQLAPSVLSPDLKPLRLATAAKLLDPSKRICQYEVPGGGVCRDEGCEDAHLSKIVIEPNDQETAEYLVNTLPASWLANNCASVPRLVSAIEQARYENRQMAFEQRVVEALATFQPR